MFDPDQSDILFDSCLAVCHVLTGTAQVFDAHFPSLVTEFVFIESTRCTLCFACEVGER